ncbi:DUF3288 family protein [Kamptonema cortianum]|uniref:DUF3288 family protein n=1 Tax=Geitlerinema calcuttense NRMC-F 0142 TaxID=2922238 RepID=A0ABT7LYN6_9CYAN|nr:DUF3288 family protein [Geitlerinema calcuttense]MCD8486131.1 DUF3288 family protein [Desertifilum sp.]MDI9638126.1 DUF3288 family protein [Geitlerinema splendidum]MDK3158064.1 DUF3288 family protein [Kamptonema cortianum]MDL5044734.1 DUF3288 family protein [Oscillatoria amoena NRMC-F 0135]MDL5057123.1 DUF3288 family protein [Geitlerinema calcuttense NRMC-F 0142]
MFDSSNGKDQQHPQYNRDRLLVDELLRVIGAPTEYHLVELARLKVRYQGFPGARDLQRDLEKTLLQWQLTEDELYERTRQIHAIGRVYQQSPDGQQEDWS